MDTPTFAIDSHTGEPIDPARDGYNAVNWTVNGIAMALELSDASYEKFRRDIAPWLDVSELRTAAEQAGARGDRNAEAQISADARDHRARLKLELAEAQKDLEEGIQPEIVVAAAEIPTLSAAEARLMKRNNHGFTRCDDKLLLALRQTGGPLKIRTNGPASKIYELQRRVAPLGIQLRLENRFRVHEDCDTEYYGDIYADLVAR